MILSSKHVDYIVSFCIITTDRPYCSPYYAIKQKKFIENKLELNSINCAGAKLFKVSMVNHGFFNGEKV